VAIFNWTDADNETHSSDEVGTATVTKGDTISFDASPSYDPKGFEGADAGISSYSWYFEDTDSTMDGKKVAHTFNDVGTYVVKLNVTDGHGNHREITKIFEVKHGPVPRLEVKNLTLSNEEPRAGQTIQIIANISNFGDAAASNLNVVFYVNDKPLGGSVRYYVYDNGSLVEANSTIPPGEYRIAKIDWTPEKGTVKLKVNVTDASEPSFSFLNEKEIKVTVGQPVWMDYIPIILAIVAIVGVVAIYYMYSKGIGPFSTEKKDNKKKKD
jgi:PKD repeat protein